MFACDVGENQVKLTFIYATFVNIPYILYQDLSADYVLMSCLYIATRMGA
jgi:hypothetical protein